MSDSDVTRETGCLALRMRCKECGWEGDQFGYVFHSRLARHLLCEVTQPVCDPAGDRCENCRRERSPA